jgi:hypothetical protein
MVLARASDWQLTAGTGPTVEGNRAADAVAWLILIAMTARTEIVVANLFGPGLGA